MPESFPPLINDRLLRVINNAKGDTDKQSPVDKTPAWIMRQAGRYLPEFRESRAVHDFFTVCRTPELACQVTLQPIDRYGPELLDAAIIFSDILVIPQAMGLVVEMVPGKGPHFPAPLIHPEDMVARIPAHTNVDEELSYVYKAITLTRHRLEGRVPLFGFVGAPWTLMAYMIEGGGSKTLSKAKRWLFAHPEASHVLLTRITEVCVDFLVGQVKAGAQALQVFDSWAGELAPREFSTFSLPYLAQIASRVKAHLRQDSIDPVPICVFARGAHYALEELAALDYDMMSLDWTIDPSTARVRCDSATTKSGRQPMILQGNADPCLLYAPRETIRTQVREMLEGFGTQHHVANLGHGMYPDHDPEQLKLYLEAIRDISMELRAPSSSS